MPENRELDERIARDFFGWKQHPDFKHLWYPGRHLADPAIVLPNFSTDIKDAWKIVEHLKAWKYSVMIKAGYGGLGYDVAIYYKGDLVELSEEMQKDLDSRWGLSEEEDDALTVTNPAKAICLKVLSRFTHGLK